MSADAVFVGFGFGAIQAGLFVYEAFRTGQFRRLVVAEVVSEVVEAVRKNGGYYHVNIAHPNGIEAAIIGPIEIYDPSSERDRESLKGAVAEAQEIATAVPSVSFYTSEQPGSIHRLLADGLTRKARSSRKQPPAIVYAAENHNHAAEILEEQVSGGLDPEAKQEALSKACFVNTVIGKMSGIVSDAADMHGLAPVTPASSRAFLVEEFNRILISQIPEPSGSCFRRGINAFEEKPDLLPFEEAKLYGHNATHALGAYLGVLSGIDRMAEVRENPALFQFMRDAFLEESGGALISRHRGIDALFTPEGYARYADDLLERMTNPHLRDTAERVGRDPKRKLGWDDRLIGTMRIVLGEGIRPWRYATGAAAAVACLHPKLWNEPGADVAPLLEPLWAGVPEGERREIISEIKEGWIRVIRWPENRKAKNI
ncbi:MAG: hypothetical protein EHM61_15920 [Acidobacteria bacterium]|nr:MAG: hypothetical protein EHM61_15920 [Acidobacteriota bacterium]